jgi:hypothetical protein
MTKDSVFTFVGAIIYLAILYMLVRPGSNGPVIISNIFGALSDLVRGSVGYTYDSTNGSWTAPQ